MKSSDKYRENTERYRQYSEVVDNLGEGIIQLDDVEFTG